MIYVFSGNAPSVIVNLDCNSVINDGNADVNLIRCSLSFKINVLDRIRKQVNDGSDYELGITVKQRIDSVFRQSEYNVICTRIILDVGICCRYGIPDVEDLHSPWGLMLANDYTDVTSSSGTIAGLNEGQAIVSEDFLQQTGTTEKDILGKTIRMTDGNEYTVSGLVKDLPQGSFLNTYAVFLADEKMTDNVDYVTFDFSDETDIRSRIKVIEDYGYSYSTNSISADRMNEIASQYSLAGTVIAIVFIIVCMVSLINSLLVTIGENAAFMELFRLLGLTGKDYMFMTCITAGIQGLIGGILGVILAYVTTGSLYKIVRNLNLKGMDILKDLQVTPKSCVMTLLICVVVSVLTGLAAFKLSSKVTADTIADSELI